MRRGTYRALAGGGGFTPAQLNPALWIEARQQDKFFQSNAGSTAVTDGSVCGFASDLSGNGFHLSSAADDITRPTWNFNGGLSYLNFDGTDDVLLRTSALGLSSATGLSIFAAIKANPGTSKTLLADGSTASTTQLYEIISEASTSSTLQCLYRNDAGTILISTAAVATTGMWDNTDKVFGFTDDSGALVSVYDNKTLRATTTYSPAGTTTVNRFALGALIRTTTAGWFATRVYSLVVVKRVLSTTERSRLIAYLGKTMGLSI